MAYSDAKSCKIGDREILHGEFASLSDRCFICNDGELEENYDNICGGMAGTGTGGVWDETRPPGPTNAAPNASSPLRTLSPPATLLSKTSAG